MRSGQARSRRAHGSGPVPLDLTGPEPQMTDRPAADRVTLESCDDEPIHIPGSIQPHGAMIVCDPDSLAITHVSRNLAAITGWTGDLFPGIPVSAVLGRELLHDLRNAAARAGAAGGPGIVLGARIGGADRLFDIAMHSHKKRCLIEIEPRPAGAPAAEAILDLARQLVARVNREADPDRLVVMAARLAQVLLGYDRVMIYRFLHNAAGRVVAEARAPHLASFLGQHFPASDIPAQARRLYMENPIRMIADAAYVPVPLDPPLAPGEDPVDMSHAQLRSVSPIHCEYLANMGVAASLSISLIVDGALWGLIACHHDSPRATPLAQRIAAELFGHCLALQIAAADRRRAMATAERVHAQLDTLFAGMEGPLVAALPARLPHLASLARCDGAALLIEGLWFATGTTPSRDQAQALLAQARPAAAGGLWHTRELRAHLPDAAASPAGVMAIGLSQLHGDSLLFFRNEEAHEIHWAGEPVKTAVQTAQGARLSPRGSFDLWREEVRGLSIPWDDDDLALARAIRTWARDALLRENERAAEDRARTAQRGRILNDELNHRVKNVISVVRSLVMQTGAGAGSVADYSDALQGRLAALAIAHDQSLGRRGGDLTALIEAETGQYRDPGRPDRVTAEGPALRLDDRAFGVLALTLHEMTTNAAKYGALSVPEGRLAIRWTFGPDGGPDGGPDDGLVLDWRESGGPAVAPPARTGFGTRLIRSTVEYDLRGTAAITHAPDGLRARLTIPARHVATGRDRPAAAPRPAPRPDALAGMTVLVVEDQGLIAMDAEDTLRRLGAADVRLAATPAEALDLLAAISPDLTLLDVALGEETAEAVAALLTARGLPFLLMTGYSDPDRLPKAMRQVPILRKPLNPAAISLAAATLARRR